PYSFNLDYQYDERILRQPGGFGIAGSGGKAFKLTTVITGLTGTILGATGILSLYLGFLGLLSSLVPPVAGVIIAAYLVRILRGRRVGKAGPVVSGIPAGPGGFILRLGFHPPGVIAYGLGASAAWLTGGVVPFFIPPLNGILVAMAVYMVLEKLFSVPSKRFPLPV
ncbi:MAG: hypothetical protein LBQ88_01660, partial [Treponema sp.]|nr:hypothetical protein [Treponema sp.]